MNEKRVQEDQKDVCTEKDRRKKEYAKPELTVHENLRTVTGGTPSHHH